MSDPRHIGVDLDSLFPAMVEQPEDSLRRTRLTCPVQIPPGVVLGTVRGEGPAADYQLPCDSRGSGLGDSAASVVATVEAECARLPLAYAWERFLHATTEKSRWCRRDLDGHDASLTEAEAIATVLRDLVEQPATDSPGDCTLVVPNSLIEAQQEALLRACRRPRQKVQLLWRPVAAALAWLIRHEGELPSSKRAHHESLGQLLHLHLGIDSWEVTSIDIVPHDEDSSGTSRRWLLPGRRVPDNERTGLLTVLPRRLLEASGSEVLSGAPDAQRWNLFWGTSWARQAVAAACRLELDPAPLPPWFERDTVARAAASIGHLLDRPTASHPVYWPLTDRMMCGAEPEYSSISAWLRAAKADFARATCIGAVVTGPLAAVRLPQGTLAAWAFLRAILGQPVERLTVEGGRAGDHALLAEGAALFGARLARGEPTYLDTLPCVETIAVRQGEPEWVNLLETDEPWVMGGRMWQSTPARTRFQIARGQAHLTLSVYREGTETCRRVSSNFERTPDRPTPVKLHVKISPGQGNPIVEVLADDRSILGGRSVTLDWDTAEDTGRSRQAELDAEPRVCPFREPREASSHLWSGVSYSRFRAWKPRGVQGLMQTWLDDPGATWRHRNGSRLEPLQVLREQLSLRDGRVVDALATAVSSDGTVVAPEDQALLQRFIARLWQELSSCHDSRSADACMRVLAWCGAGHEPLREHLDGWLRTGRSVCSNRVLIQTCGQCLQDPERIARFLHRLHGDWPGKDELEAIARLLMLREEALAHTDSEVAFALLERANRVAADCVESGSFKFLFRYAALTVVYLLRMRRYDDKFLEPGSPGHAAVRQTFESAARKIEADPYGVIGGAVNIPQRVAQIIDYLDRRGAGRLVALAFDDAK